MNLNATLVAQLVVFFILAWVTMKFVWPPIVKALDERAKKIADGLAAADKAKSDLAHAEKKVVEELRKARESATDVRAAAEKQAAVFLDEARAEAARIIAQAREAAEAEAGVAAQRAKEALRDQVAHLAVAGAEKILRRRKNEELMSEGVTIMDPATTYIDDDVKVGRDTVIYPMTWLEHGTVIGEECEIGPNVRFQDVKCGNRVTGQFIYAHECQIDDDVKLGQFVHLRPNTHLFEGVKIDNFIEVQAEAGKLILGED